MSWRRSLSFAEDYMNQDNPLHARLHVQSAQSLYNNYKALER